MGKGKLISRAEKQFRTAVKECEVLGITLRRCSNLHYQFSHSDGWLINAYPTTGTLYVDPKRPKPPLSNLPKHWTIASLTELLLDAVDRELCRKCRAAGL